MAQWVKSFVAKPVRDHGGHRRTCVSLLLSPTMWVLGIKLWCSGSAAHGEFKDSRDYAVGASSLFVPRGAKLSSDLHVPTVAF